MKQGSEEVSEEVLQDLLLLLSVEMHLRSDG